MGIDIHAHYVTPKAIEKVRKNPGMYGVKLESTSDGKEYFVFSYGEKIRPLFQSLLDLERRKQNMIQQGMTHKILSTWPDLFGYAQPLEEGIKWHRLLNESLADDLSEVGDFFSGMASVPLQDANAAARELEFAVSKLGFNSVMIASNVVGMDLDHPSLNPFWQEAVQLDVPVVIHPLNVAGEERVNRFYTRAALGYPYDTTIAGGYLLLGGLFDRFPDVKIVLVHAGGFLPYQIGRLQHTYEVMEEARSVAKKGPLEYFKLLYFDTITHFPPALNYLVDLVGSSQILLGSDEPFGMSDAHPIKTVKDTGLEHSESIKITELNAKKLFRVNESIVGRKITED